MVRGSGRRKGSEGGRDVKRERVSEWELEGIDDW